MATAQWQFVRSRNGINAPPSFRIYGNTYSSTCAHYNWDFLPDLNLQLNVGNIYIFIYLQKHVGLASEVLHIVSIGVNGNNNCFFPCGPAINWWLLQGISRLLPGHGWDSHITARMKMKQCKSARRYLFLFWVCSLTSYSRPSLQFEVRC